MEFNYFHSLPFTSKTNLFFVFFWLKDTGRNILETLKPYFMQRMSTSTLFTQWWTISSEFHDPSRVSFSERSMPKDLWEGCVMRSLREKQRFRPMILVLARRTPSKSALCLWKKGRCVRKAGKKKRRRKLRLRLGRRWELAWKENCDAERRHNCARSWNSTVDWLPRREWRETFIDGESFHLPSGWRPNFRGRCIEFG